MIQKNSLIQNNSKTIKRNTPFNSISTNSIFSLNKLNNSLYNPIVNTSGLDLKWFIISKYTLLGLVSLPGYNFSFK